MPGIEANGMARMNTGREPLSNDDDGVAVVLERLFPARF